MLYRVCMKFLCVSSCVCVRVKLFVCVLISVPATRSYSRSTGALHTPDVFGAAGEGWVHLFLCTSPTFLARIVQSLFVAHFCCFVFFWFFSVPVILFCRLTNCFLVHRHPFLTSFIHFVALQDVEPSSGTACFRLFSCQLITVFPVFYLFCLFSSASSLLEHQLLCFRVILSPPSDNLT